MTDGLGFVEVVSPCPPGFGKSNAFPTGLDMMEYFDEHAVIDPEADLREVGVNFDGEPLVCGNFISDPDGQSYTTVKQEFLAQSTGGDGT